MREDEVAAAAMGVHLVRVKLWAYAIGASIGGFAGVFLGVFQNTINVDQFEFGFSVFILCMIILGGMGNLAGVILGAVALSMINRFLLPELNSVPEKFGLDFDVTAISFGIFGFLLLVMMVLRPRASSPTGRRKMELHEDEFDDALIEVKSAVSDVARTATSSRRRASRSASAASSRSTTSTSPCPHKSIVAIIGPNGAGKTTFFNCMTGLYKPTTGTVLFDGRDITAKAPHIVTQAGDRAHVPEHQAVQDDDRARERAGRAPRAHEGAHHGLDLPHAVRAPRGARDRGVRAPTCSSSSASRAATRISRPACPTATSAGSRSPARWRPTRKLLLLDEPTAGMNPQESEELRELMEKLRTERGISLLLIEHDMKVVMNVSDHITVLDGGEKIAAGSPQEVRANPRVIEAYLGSQA